MLLSRGHNQHVTHGPHVYIKGVQFRFPFDNLPCPIAYYYFQLFPDYGDVYNIAWSGANRWLLAGTAAGLVGWNVDDGKVKKLGKDYR